MSYKVVFLPDAEVDLLDIEEYLSKFYANTAGKFFSKLKKQLTLLQEMPYLYSEYEIDPFFRKMVIGEFLLFYVVDEERQKIVVHRIFHSARDVSKQILGSR